MISLAKILVALLIFAVFPGSLSTPSLLGQHAVDEHYAIPRYHFSYGVHDTVTGDIKSQSESREGDSVTGHYSLVEPDGSVRTVQYTANDLHGFNALVSKSGPGVHTPVVPLNHKPHHTNVFTNNHILPSVLYKPSIKPVFNLPLPPASFNKEFPAFATVTARPPPAATTPSIQKQLLALYPQPTLLPVPAQQEEPQQTPRPFYQPPSRPSSTGPIQFPQNPEDQQPAQNPNFIPPSGGFSSSGSGPSAPPTGGFNPQQNGFNSQQNGFNPQQNNFFNHQNFNDFSFRPPPQGGPY